MRVYLKKEAAEEIKTFMRKNNMTNAFMAKKLKMSTSFYTSILSGSLSLGALARQRIQGYFNMSYEELFEERG